MAKITAHPSSFNLVNDEIGKQTFYLELTGIEPEDIQNPPVASANWIYQLYYEADSNEAEFKVEENTTPYPRTATITIGDGTNSCTVYVLQYGTQGGVSEYNIPMWKDTYFLFPAGDNKTLDYVITDSADKIIFSGRAYKMENKETFEINVSDVCRDYLGTLLHFDEEITAEGIYDMKFNIYMVNGEELIKINEFHFYDSWSYEDINNLIGIARVNGLVSLNYPIKTSLPPGAYVPISLFAPSCDGQSSTYNHNITIIEETYE